MEVMQQFSYSMGLKMFDCRDKLVHSHLLNEDIIKFWNNDYILNRTATGCLIFCTMVALDLVEARGLIESNAVGFLTAKGADDKMVKTLLDLYRQCARAVKQVHHCAATLELANCFRRGIWKIGWTPDIQPLLVTRRRDC